MEEVLGRRPADGRGVLGDDRDAQQVGELDVVETDQGDRTLPVRQHTYRRDRHTVVAA